MVGQFVLLIALCAAGADANPLFEKLQSEGVPMANGPALRLPAPTMPDGLDAAKQRAALASIADVDRPVEALLRKSVLAPFVLKTERENVATAGRHVDLWFVAYGDLERITSEDFLKSRTKAQEKPAGGAQPRGEGRLPSKAVVLSAQQLAERGLRATKSARMAESYSHATFPLFDRVLLSVTSHVVQSRNDDSALVASVLDTRFQNDREFPIFWQKLDRDINGNLVLGAKHPYQGMGSYAKITKLADPPGALFVECHAVFDEPHGWFDGVNLLRSKLPILAQENVRKFRQEIR
jgi:hypothetical protein